MGNTMMGTLLNASGVSQGQIPVAVDASGRLYNNASGDSTANIGTIRIEQDSRYNAVTISRFAGATSMATSQLATTVAAATWVVARPTRRSVLLRNHGASDSVYWGVPTVSSLNGVLLKGGESVSVTFTGLIQVIAESNTPKVSFADEFDNP